MRTEAGARACAGSGTLQFEWIGNHGNLDTENFSQDLQRWIDLQTDPLCMTFANVER